jgi:arginase
MDINVIGVPLYYGCDRKGVELGPDKLREKNVLDIISKHGHTVTDRGDLFINEIPDKEKYEDHPKMKYLNEIIKVNSNLAHEVYTSLDKDKFPLILGGDHALGLGSVSGSSRYFEDIAVIWVDAHGDINTPETSPSGNVHGMPLGAALGVGDKNLRNVYFEGTKVQPENVFILGARDLDAGEVALAQEKNINIYSMEQINEQGLDIVLASVLQEIEERNVNAIHLSYDLDSMDGPLVPGTGLPIPDGFSVKQVKLIFEKLFNTELVRSMDIVELNPLLDKGDMTAELAIELIDYVSQLIAELEHTTIEEDLSLELGFNE